jgi:carboxypeptidase Q
MKKTVMLIIVMLGVLAVSSTSGQEKLDTAIISRIRTEGLEHSHVMETFDHLVNIIGPRLTASPAYKAAVDWSRNKLASMGFDNVHVEPWEFGRGWQLERLTAEMLEPRYMPLIAYAKGWSPSTNGKLVGSPVWIGNPAEQATRYRGKLAGSIVMTRPVQQDFIRQDRTPAGGDLRRRSLLAPDEQQAQSARDQQINALLQNERPGVTLEPSLGEHGTVFVTGRDGGANAVPGIVLASEHYNIIARLLAANFPVKLAIDLQTRFFEQDKNAYNVIAEIRGVDPRIGDEIVMAGAHLDSWHTGTGATDNADGVAVEIEALRILKALGVKPRRTIRIALWGGEEQGLLGSKEYVRRHFAGDQGKAARDKFSVYFNLDNGTPPITGFYLEGNQEMQPLMEAWLKPLNDLGANISTLQGIGATDHLSFMTVGLPGFQAVQDYTNYDVRTHHTNVDTYERVSPQALKQASVVVATVLYDAAMRDARVPRAK